MRRRSSVSRRRRAPDLSICGSASAVARRGDDRGQPARPDVRRAHRHLVARAECPARLAVRAACRAAHAGHERAGAAPGTGAVRNCHRGDRSLGWTSLDAADRCSRVRASLLGRAVDLLLLSRAQTVLGRHLFGPSPAGARAKALEPEEDGRTRTRRIVTWWLAAAIGQWFSNGALLVVPACVVVMSVVLLHRNGWRAAWQFVVLGVSWLVSFGLNYALALRHNLTNRYLQEYWAFAMAPASEDALGRLQWLAAQMGPFASKPGGTELDDLLAGGSRRDPVCGPPPAGIRRSLRGSPRFRIRAGGTPDRAAPRTLVAVGGAGALRGGGALRRWRGTTLARWAQTSGLDPVRRVVGLGRHGLRAVRRHLEPGKGRPPDQSPPPDEPRCRRSFGRPLADG